MEKPTSQAQLSNIDERWWRAQDKQKSFDATKIWRTTFEQRHRHGENRNAKKPKELLE
ncbi:MAG: hypothetical protein ACUZ9M_06895 [Candidatus Scalindua sp.]